MFRGFYFNCLVLKKVDHKVNEDGALKKFIKKGLPASKIFRNIQKAHSTAYSRLIMGYGVSESLTGTETLKALQMASKNRRYTDDLIHHSERGLQYCSAAYVKTSEDKNISISMAQHGHPYDNAIAERVNGILKDEFGLDEVFEDH